MSHILTSSLNFLPKSTEAWIMYLTKSTIIFFRNNVEARLVKALQVSEALRLLVSRCSLVRRELLMQLICEQAGLVEAFNGSIVEWKLRITRYCL
jgi:hypothetical protein